MSPSVHDKINTLVHIKQMLIRIRSRFIIESDSDSSAHSILKFPESTTTNKCLISDEASNSSSKSAETNLKPNNKTISAYQARLNTKLKSKHRYLTYITLLQPDIYIYFPYLRLHHIYIIVDVCGHEKFSMILRVQPNVFLKL